jgi:hypothetical protein
MGFRFSSFVAGAAENITETLKEDEKQAAVAATYGVKALKEQYDKVQAENRKLETELSENVRTLRTFDKTATEAELFAAATNKAYMEMAIEAAKANPASFKVGDVVKIKEDNPSPQTAMERIKAYTTIPAVSKAARQAEGVDVTEEKTGLFGLGTLRSRASARAGSKAEEQTAKAMGVSIEQLRAAGEFKRPEIATGAEFDFTSLQDLEVIKKNIQKEAFDISDSGDKDKINNVMVKAARVVAAESLFKTNKKTEAEIQTDLVNEIQEKQKNKDPVGASLAATLLAQRKALLAAPSKGDKTDADKISQSNLITAATRSRASVIENVLGPGKLIKSVDRDGNVTLTLREMGESELFKRGNAIAANSLIKEYTKPDGTPKSEMHKNALLSTGVMFDDNGKAIRPEIPDVPAPAANKTKPAAATPAAATPAAGRGVTSKSTPKTTIAPTNTPTLRWNPDKQDFE